MFIEAFDAHMDRERAVYAAFAATGIGLFSYAWQGWWYIFDFLFAVLIGITMYYLVRAWIQHDYDIRAIWSAERVRDVTVIGFIFVIGSLLTVSLFRNISGFFSGFLEPFRFTIIDQAAKANLWPNVFTTVAELGDTSIASVVNQMGGGGAFAKTIFFIALMAIPLTLTREGEWDWKDWTLVGGSAVFFLLMVSDFMLQMNQIVYLALLGVPVAAGGLMSLTGREADIKYAAVLTVWFIGTMYASTKGMRFMLLLVPAFAVSVGLAVGIIRKRLARSFSDMNSLWINIPTILVVFLLLYNPIVSAHNQASNEIPAMNDAWYQSLEKIDQEAEPDAIVNSWWDFGHWFKAIADRAVTFDGGSQNTPMAHWVGKTLLTGSEEEAVGILRMLDCGSNLAYENVNNVTDDTVRSVNILYDIVTMNESAARDRLDQEGFTPDEINTVMDRTHCEPPENYFITSEDMVGKAGVWAHFGSWSFERAFIYNELVGERPDTAVETIVDKFGYSEDRARSLYFDAQGLQTSDEANAWIAPWPSYQTGSWQSCTQTNQTLECRINARLGQQQGGIVVLESVTADLENPKNSSMSIGLYTQQGQRQGGVGQQMKALGIADNKSISTYSFDTSQSNRGILVDDVENRVLMMHPELLNSTFTKLFFMDGRYMDHFNKFSDRTSFNGQNIKIWTVDWPES
jgi:asparagine N-glycosylation enzyme membrane subunit Stt3